MNKLNINDYIESCDIIPTGKGKFRFWHALKLWLIVLKRFVVSFLVVGAITGVLLFISVYMYMNSSDDSVFLDLNATKFSMTGFIYVNDDDGNPQEYQKLYNSENRVWADFQDIPQHMKDAIIAIEDKRFYKHHGIDLIRTSGAVLNLLKGSPSYGGSTLTQQLIKNITDENQVSLTRKLREIFRAIKLEEKYSKDDILETYLNSVSFGAGCRGVEAAANTYFGKSIGKVTLAEAAAIAGITQNPSAYNPFNNLEKNKIRRELILKEMLDQQKITETEYQTAMDESQNMVFKKNVNAEIKHKDGEEIRNWYVEALLKDIIGDLQKKYNIGKTAAEDMLFTQGLKIYCAMDKKAQHIAEETIANKDIMPKDEALEVGFLLMDYNGRVLATIGSSKEKTANLLYDRANFAQRQLGSTIKPLSAYTLAINEGLYNFSSLIPDEPLKIDAYGKGELVDWPRNWYGSYKGRVLLNWAIEKSANAPVAHVIKALTTQKSYEFLNKKLGFTNLDSADSRSLSALVAGGTHVGVTVREVTGAFQIFGNDGRYHKPYTYFYVTDRNDKVVLDNRHNAPIQAVTPQTATIMNRLLRQVIVGAEGTGRGANIGDWNIIGKTGTTDDDFDSWFMGLSPYAVGGIWTGYDNPKRIGETGAAIRIWKHIMINFLKDKEPMDYSYDEKVISALYCLDSGCLANTGCPHSTMGYYSNVNTPSGCPLHSGEAAQAQETLPNEIAPANDENADTQTNETSQNVNNTTNQVRLTDVYP